MTPSSKRTKNPAMPPQTGSDSKRSEPRFLAIGQITKPHGVKGDLSVVVLTEFTERFDAMETVYVGTEEAATEYAVSALRWHKERVLIRFQGFSNRNDAERLRGLYLLIPREAAMPLEPGVYYSYQLIGLTVIADDGEVLGTLVEIIETGANDVYVVNGPAGELLLPATGEVILSVDLEAGQMIVHLLDGLRTSS